MKFLIRKTLFPTLACLFALTLSFQGMAAEPAGNLVSRDLVDDITNGTVFRGVPAGFPLPGNILSANIRVRFLGSLERGLTQELYLRSETDGEAFRNIVREGYREKGWIDISTETASGASPYINLCHDELGSLDIINNGGMGNEDRISIRYRSRMLSDLSGASSCEERKALVDAGYAGGAYSVFQEYYPVLDVPEQAEEIGLVGIFRSGGGSIGIGAQASFRTSSNGRVTIADSSVDELHEGFSQQLEEQGWSEAGSVSVTASAISVWRKHVELPAIAGVNPAIFDALDLVSQLIILPAGDDEYEVVLHMHSN